MTRWMLCSLMIALAFTKVSEASDKPNVLIITMDDMSCDSVGVFGCKLPDTTPTIDELATRCMRFNHAFVQVGNCMPSRNVMFSGRYPHNNRVEGFYQVRDPDYPVMSDLMKTAGYFTGIRGKVPHSTPYHPYPAWDLVLDTLTDGQPAHPKNAESYYLSTKMGIDGAKQAGKPFCLNINISDPHKPFYAERGMNDPNVPSRVFTADEVPVPGFLFDDVVVREELALYYSSVRRGDDCLSRVLAALGESGERDSTVIFFLSDHGMPLPFAKTQLYFHSTRTPWMVCWPGVTSAGTVDDTHLISGVDLLPTLLDIVGIGPPDGMDGRSFAPVLRGEHQAGREYVVTEYNENSGGNRSPMRSIVGKDFGYIFNPWSNGTRDMATATKGTQTYRRMKELAPTNAEIADRLRMIDHRVVEELYNYSTDHDARNNLVENEKYQAEYDKLTTALESWMVATNDPMLDVFRDRDNAEAREAYMAKVTQEAAERLKNKAAKPGKKGPAAGKKGKNAGGKAKK
jgi:N-sulfoglucosamine sulfohydrolase